MKKQGKKAWDWSWIDKLVYINLDQGKDRAEMCLANLNAVQFPADKIVRFSAIKDPKGALGCSKSHLAVLRSAQKFGWCNVLILEDDMIFDANEDNAKHVADFMVELQQHPWDVALLSGYYSIINIIETPLYKLSFAQCSNSYLVNKHYYSTLIETITENVSELELGDIYIPLDEKWLPLQRRDNWMAIYPCAGIQAEGYSDIERRHVKRESIFRLDKDTLTKYGSDFS